MIRWTPAFLAILLVSACGSDGGDVQNENEIITTVTLTFVPEGGGAAVTAVFDDPDGDGGDAPTVDVVDIAPGVYELLVEFANGLEDPAEDITEEVADEADEHQVFLTGSAVRGPASPTADAPLTHMYADEDVNGLPIGLQNTVSASAGSGDLVITLRHLPPLGADPVKTVDTAAEVRDGGFAAISGNTDAQVTFAVAVN